MIWILRCVLLIVALLLRPNIILLAKPELQQLPLPKGNVDFALYSEERHNISAEIDHDDSFIVSETGVGQALEGQRVHIIPFDANDWYEWINFPSNNERNAVLSAMIGSAPMLIQTISALSENPKHPSFLRYFNPEDHPTVLLIYRHLLAVLGFAEYGELRSCLRVTKLQIWFGDGPRRNLCKMTGAYAYTWHYDDSFGTTRYYISICNHFFQAYQKYDFVPCSKIGPSSGKIFSGPTFFSHG